VYAAAAVDVVSLLLPAVAGHLTTTWPSRRSLFGPRYGQIDDPFRFISHFSVSRDTDLHYETRQIPTLDMHILQTGTGGH